MLEKIWEWVSLNIISPINWNSLHALFNKGVYWELTEAEHDKLRKLLAKDHYIILVRRKTHFTTYLISLGNFIRTGNFGYYSHALMNLECDVNSDHDFELMEAIGKGVGYASFMRVFDCDSVCLLKPYSFTTQDWTEALDRLRKQNGKKYDTLFNLADDKKLSCCELVYEALEGDIDKMPNFVDMIKKYKNITPDMFYQCKDMEIIYEVRH